MSSISNLGPSRFCNVLGLVGLVGSLTVSASCATPAAKLNSTPGAEAVADACSRTRIVDNADGVCPLLPGMAVPDVDVVDLEGAVRSLADITKEPTILIFYRGGWCPFCNTQMGQLQAIEGDLKALGYQIVAMSPDDAKGLKASVEKHELSYQLLSDPALKAATAFGVAFKTDVPMSMAMRAMAPQHEALPVPAVFIVRDGTIRFTYANPNYKVRLGSELLMAAARADAPVAPAASE